uniref:Dehydrin-like protein 3 n=1 Tax=Alternaria brassicicola TaxID=29001 RepID=L0BUT7_ALTBR|nr:dehydrin-like protein 3 [Alternaria brassicicola]
MDKIKSVLHAHKKDDAVAHDAQTSSSTAGGQQHPIYDQMSTGDEGRNATAAHTGQPIYEIKTTSGAPYTELAQPGGSAGLHAHDAHGRPAHVGTDGPSASTSTPATGAHHNPSITQDNTATSRPLGGTNTATGDAHRPDAYPRGHAPEPSVASIKSGVIGFGAGANQGHAAMSTHNPTQEYMSQDQVVGGGHPGTAGMTHERGANPGQTHPKSGTMGGGPLGDNPAYTTEHRPYESTLRQESYTADTDRSFPLAGGVISKPHEDSTSTRHLTEHTSSIHNKGISEREPGTKEKEVGIHNSDSPARDSYGREGLAGAAATAATAIGASKTLAPSEERHVQDQGLETRQATYGHVSPAAAATTVPRTGDLSGQSTTDYHPEALTAAIAAPSRSSNLPPSTQEHEYGAHNINPSGTTHSTIAGAPTAGMSSTAERPLNPRLESHRHIPGEYIATPSDEKTFLNYAPVIQPTSTGPSGNLSSVEPTSTLDSSHVQSSVDPASTSGPHELRHTGTLEEPRPKSADENHHGRDTAIAGGLGAGAVGLGTHAASKHDSQHVGSNLPLYEESSPYSSKVLDPRVLGHKSRLEEQKFDEQRFDPQAKTEAAPSSGSTISGPPVSHDSSQPAGSQHHYGRDAAVLGTSAAAVGGMHHASNRNDTPSTGTAIPPRDSPYTSTTGSNVAAHQPTSNFSKPLPTASTSASQPIGHNNFYGAVGAPAPVPDKTLQQPSNNLDQVPVATTVPERHPEHHYGRDAGLAGAGAAAAGIYAANRDNTDSGSAPSTIGPHSSNATNIMDPRVQPDPSKQIHHKIGPTAEDPASRTIGPHDSNIANVLDPRVKPDPSKQKEHTTVGPHQSDTLNRLDPKVDEKAGQQSERHYGRDAAVVGGAGVAGYGAYEATNAHGDYKMTQPGANEATTAHGNQSMTQRAYEAINAYGNHRMTQPEAAMPDQRYDLQLQRHGSQSCLVKDPI